jgi:hypothetical protein
MSESQATHDPVAEFVSVLGAELTSSPSELLARRHVKRAAVTARRRHVRRRRLAVRSGAVAAAMAMVISTSGVALAGGLPRPMQTMAADAAQMLPVPLPIPYPAAPAVDELPEETLPYTAETQDEAVVQEEPSESEAALSDTPADGTGSVSDTTTSQGTWTGRHVDEDSPVVGDRTLRREDGSAVDDRHWDAPDDEYDRGWDDGRKGDRWVNGSNDRGRRDNDRDRSRDTNRDR